MKDLTLISSPNFLYQYDYFWILERFKIAKTPRFEIDIFPSTPNTEGIQILKNELLTEINSRNIFDFDFQPIENFNKKNKEEYLNLVFIDGLWTEEYFLYSIRKYSDWYAPIATGYLNLNQLE